MALPVFQRTIVTEAGDVIAGAEVEVVLESTGLAADIFSDRAGNTSLTNPFFTGADGFAKFFAAPDEYRITATGPTGSIVFRFVVLTGDAALMTNNTGGATLGTVAALDIGTAAGEVPTNGDLGTMSTQDANAVAITGGTVNLAANGLTVGTDQLVTSGGNVGIGTTSPASPIDINRTSTNGNIATFRKDGTVVGSIGIIATDRLYIRGGSASSILIDGYLGPGTVNGNLNDNVMDCGIVSSRWNDVYATNGTIQTSDRNEKQDIEELSEAEQRVAVAAKGLLRKFRWKNSVEEKGDDARVHFGIIAQDLQAAFEAEGLDAGRYAMFIHSTWTDEETGEERSRMGVRYSELLAFIIAAI